MTLPWAGRLFQMGYVVPDLPAAVRYFHNNLGVEKFLMRENTSLRDQRFRGDLSDFRQSIAFCYSGDTQIELIQPISGPSTYTEFLGRNPEGGVQHLGYRVDDLEEATGTILSLGYEMVQSGLAGHTQLAYFQLPNMCGTLIELLQIEPAEIEMFARLKRGEIGVSP